MTETRSIFDTAPRALRNAARHAETGIVALLQFVKVAFLISPFWLSIVQPVHAEVVTTTVEEIEYDDAPATEDFGSPAANPATIAKFGPFYVLSAEKVELNGPVGADTVREFGLMLHAYPKLKTINMVDCPGTENDEANLEIARQIRARGMDTHVPANGSVRSGGVELFLAGVNRTAEPGAEFGVHSWVDSDGREAKDVPANDPVHASYVRYYEEMGFTPDQAKAFYAFTNTTRFDDVHYMTGPELARFQILK